MSYVSSTVASVVDQINRRYFLPAIQRPYVWDPDQVIGLFDSLLKGYPISSFLFWEIRPDRRADWDIYKFVENFRLGATHNETAETDGRDVVLVLDGQQRLTSLFIGLRGSYTMRLKYAKRSNPDAWSTQRLFIDLLQDPAIDPDEFDEEELGVTFGLRFAAEQPISDSKHLWMKVGQILDCTSDEKFYEMKDAILERLPDTSTKAEHKIASKNIERLYRAIWKDEVISFYTEKDQSYDRVLDIFVRANDGGTKLSKSDLLLSMITSKWEGVSARTEIYQLVERLNSELELRNSIDKDFVMKACLVLCDLDQRYKVSNFTSSNLLLIEQNWRNIKVSLEATLRLVNRFGIDGEILTSRNALLPIAYYLHQIQRRALEGSTPFETSNSLRIHRWLLGSLINGVFGGNSDSTIGKARAILQESLKTEKDFPDLKLVQGLASRGRVANFDENNIETVLNTEYGNRMCFLAVSLLYEGQHWSYRQKHIDHIIPRALTERSKLMALGLAEDKIRRIQESVDRLGNLELLIDRENREKSDRPFADWIETRDPTFLKRHLIPEDPALWHIAALPEFVKAREALIRERLRKLYFTEPKESDDKVANWMSASTFS